MRWSKTALETKVASIDDKHDGEEFVRAVVEFADTLEPEDRKTLQRVLLAHADEKHAVHLPRIK
jgi:hypothetical protein